MTALWVEPDIRSTGEEDCTPDLHLVGAGPVALPGGGDAEPDGEWVHGLRLVHPSEPTLVPHGRRRVSAPVRRRRTLLAAMAVAVAVLALPLSGTGGRSHAAGSAPAEIGRSATYTVEPGDSLWSIAERVDPSTDPRPEVARLAARSGSDTVVPGERIVIP